MQMADGPDSDGRGMRATLARLRRPPGASQDEVAELRATVAQLQAAVSELDDEMQEARRLNRRLAEITDIVQELLLPTAQRDETRLRERLDSYTSSL
jgi:cell shape-determining protein MreC